jgi:hypothetical protein
VAKIVDFTEIQPSCSKNTQWTTTRGFKSLRAISQRIVAVHSDYIQGEAAGRPLPSLLVVRKQWEMAVKHFAFLTESIGYTFAKFYASSRPALLFQKYIHYQKGFYGSSFTSSKSKLPYSVVFFTAFLALSLRGNERSPRAFKI